MQYHIKRCTAPCVGYVDKESYLANVKHAVLFLQGKNNEVIDELAKKMEQASQALEYETAARIRDQIVSLRRIQEKQYITSYRGNTDVIGVVSSLGAACLHVLTIRAGRLIGTKSYFPAMPKNESDIDVLTAFLPQYYLNPVRSEALPDHVLLNIKLPERQWIQDALSEKSGKKIIFSDHCKGKNLQWLKMAAENAKHALQGHLAGRANVYRRIGSITTSVSVSEYSATLRVF